MSGVQQPFGTTYEVVPPSTTGQVMGNLGAKGDTLVRIVATVTTSATSTLSIIDGSTSIALIPATTGVGVYSLTIEVQCLLTKNVKSLGTLVLSFNGKSNSSCLLGISDSGTGGILRYLI
mgnify:CR=1 FL=1